MKTDENGTSTCKAGMENFEIFDNRRGVWCQYEFRSRLTGRLFTCVAPSLESARVQRDEFLTSELERICEDITKGFQTYPQL